MADDAVLSHPEILSHERLVEVLSNRGMAEDDLVSKEKRALVELCYRYVVPLPQRATNMRRANRLHKQLCPVKWTTTPKTETPDMSIGSKRKQPNIEMDWAVKAAKLSNFLHKVNVEISPTSNCMSKIDKLSMNCTTQTPIKPVKLSRKCLGGNPSEHTEKLKLAKRASVSPTTNLEDSISSMSDSPLDSEEEKQRKFKRTTVTWP